MYLSLKVFVVCAALVVAGCSATKTMAGAEPAPAFTLPTLSGGETSIAEYRGKVVLLHFWATWCESCREELPSLAALGKWLGDAEFAVIAIAIASEPQAVREFVEDVHGPITFLVDASSKVRNSYSVTALPMTYIIGKNGEFMERFEGPRDWSRAEDREQLRAMARR